MKVLTIATAKGGTGKTTVAANLAARAVQVGKRVALFDLNADQGDLTQWYAARCKPKGKPMFMRLIPVQNITEDVEVCRAAGFDWVISDVPPADLDIIETSILRSDAVLIPVRPSYLDIVSITPIIEIARARRVPFAFVLNAVDTRMHTLIEPAKEALARHGPLFKTQVRYAKAYITSMALGKSGPEVDKNLAGQIDDLWAEVEKLASRTEHLAARTESHHEHQESKEAQG